jgi:hypothetical protein
MPFRSPNCKGFLSFFLIAQGVPLSSYRYHRTVPYRYRTVCVYGIKRYFEMTPFNDALSKSLMSTAINLQMQPEVQVKYRFNPSFRVSQGFLTF